MKRMAEDSYLFTSEAVAEGHPDKVADQISDRILDQLIHTDFDVRAGIETMVTSNLVVLSGETSLKNFNEKINICRSTSKYSCKNIYLRLSINFNNLTNKV